MDISPSSGNNAISDFAPDGLAYGKRGVSGNIVETSCWRYGERREPARYECGMNESGASLFLSAAFERTSGAAPRYRPSESPLLPFLSFARTPVMIITKHCTKLTESYLCGAFYQKR